MIEGACCPCGRPHSCAARRPRAGGRRRRGGLPRALQCARAFARLSSPWSCQRTPLCLPTHPSPTNSYRATELKENRHPTKEELDAVSTTVPVFAQDGSGHHGSVNSYLLANVLGFKKGMKDPVGERSLRVFACLCVLARVFVCVCAGRAP